MKEKIYAICCSNEKYSMRLSDYCNRKNTLPRKVFCYSSEEKLLEAGEKYDIELVITDEEYEEKFKSKNMKVLCLDMYESADTIMRRILSAFNKGEEPGSRRTRIYGVYSADGRIGKTTFSLALANRLAEKERVLFVSLEEFSELSGLFSEDESGGLSRCMYLYETGKEDSEYAGCFGKFLNFDYLYPVENPDDICYLEADELMQFFDKLCRIGKYDIMVVDFGNAVKMPWSVFTECDRVFCPTNPGKSVKFNKFEQYIDAFLRKEISEKVSRGKFTLPFIEKEVPLSSALITSENYRLVCEEALNR